MLRCSDEQVSKEHDLVEGNVELVLVGVFGWVEFHAVEEVEVGVELFLVDAHEVVEDLAEHLGEVVVQQHKLVSIHVTAARHPREYGSHLLDGNHLLQVRLQEASAGLQEALLLLL
eukprot:CAMPEP_0116921878 /NCGR_PEP_ID=MMETSP0467-20121206/21913_1 /TAXON_ID=283647 /ORGANISM="Mesodinium pulex, Strain SPMC105" /LENGTH=115 /DNA_ID=CAMNT_0004600071 /DNA_START=237 /DNA_END=584 /DNA_ORIENTATION=-